VLTAHRADDGKDAVADLTDTIFSSIDFSHGVLLAISGGGDSTALLLLLKEYLDRNAPQTPLLAVTVDHALRPESAAEACSVAASCARQGIAHRTMVWSGQKPANGIPAAAREARYRLLAQAAAEAGISLMMTAHTADDQVETVLMRRARTEGRTTGRGLAGMAPATLYDWRTWIVRPLLDVRREALRTFLRRQDIDWIEDPTNTDEDYERPRIRAALRSRRKASRMDDLLATAKAAASERTDRSRRAAMLIRTFASLPAPGLVRLDPAFSHAERDAAVTALRILLATVGGTPFPPDEARTAGLLDKIAAARLCATLSRTLVDARPAGIFLHRERRGLPAASAATDGMVWDGRYRINFHDEPGPLVIGPGGGNIPAPPTKGENEAPASLVAAAKAAGPALRRRPTPPHAVSGKPPEAVVLPLVAPFAHFLPSFDLDPADTVATLIGAQPLPALPFTTGKTPTDA